MNILAFYPGHNAAVCILRDGAVALNMELERYTRIKHDYGYREDFIVFCLEKAGLTIDDIDLVCTNAWVEAPYAVRTGTTLTPSPVPSTREAAFQSFTVEMLGRKIPALAVNHHLAHVACAYFTSPFDEAAILTIDGGGDNENTSIAFARGGRLEWFQRGRLPNLCVWWASLSFNNYRMPRLHEWDPGSGAGKIMGLSAYGKIDPEMTARLRADMASSKRKPTYTDPRYPAFNDNEDLSDTKSARAQNLAAVLQAETESFLSLQLQHLARETAVGDLCYAGGLALNCVANTVAMRQGPFKRLHVPPCPNDTGLALGMALWAWHQHLGHKREASYFSPYTGPSYDEASFDEALAAARQACPQIGVEPLTPVRLAAVLADGNVCAVYRQRSEAGPRALGHRSLLCRPDIPDIRDKLNRKVKMREWYRPFAPIVLAEAAPDVLQNGLPSSPYMTTSATIAPEWREKMAGVTHVDHSTRPQILHKDHEPFIHDLISRVAATSGVPALLNTSFNRSEPIVETPLQAVDTFLKMPLPYLALGDYLLHRPLSDPL